MVQKYVLGMASKLAMARARMEKGEGDWQGGPPPPGTAGLRNWRQLKLIYFGSNSNSVFFSMFVDIGIDLSRNYKIELFRDWYASIGSSRPRNRPQVPILVDIFQVYFELRLSLVATPSLRTAVLRYSNR